MKWVWFIGCLTGGLRAAADAYIAYPDLLLVVWHGVPSLLFFAGAWTAVKQPVPWMWRLP